MIQREVDNIADQLQRDQALTPEQSFIIQAPAGSGKTGLLIQRYLNLLSTVDAPEQIVAITFTRKAAAEMKARILDALEIALTGTMPESNHDKTTFKLASAALKRDQQKAWQIIETPRRLRIQTIDSLCATLTRQMPLLSRLGTQPETVEEPERLYQRSAINTLTELESGEGWSNSIAELVLHLDNDLPKIKNLIVNMLRKRDQWLPYVIQEHDRHDMERSLISMIEKQFEIVVRTFPATLTNELISLLQFAAQNLQKSNLDNPLAACLNINTLPAASIDDLPYWQGIYQLLLTKTGTWRNRFTVNEGFPPANKNDKKRMLALIAELQKAEGLRPVLAIVNQLPPPNYTDAEWQIIKALCNLLKLATVQLRLIFAERNQMDFIGIAESAITALGTDSEPTDLAMTLDYHIKHLLVDEYQDISVNQYRLLQCLIRGWSVDDDHSLFLVGDPMQSIYRFREAEVSLFIKTFHEQCLGQVPLKALSLSVNFRSQQAVVDWVNDSFTVIFPRYDDVINGAVSLSRAIAYDQTKSNNNVVVYPLYNSADQKEAQHIIAIIEKIKQQHSEQSIAILVRSRSHLVNIIPALKETNIGFKAIDIEGLGKLSPIQDLLALTRAYLFPADRVAWLACLRAPWTGLKIDSLFKLANKTRTIWECINDKTLIEKLESEEQVRLERLRVVFETMFNHRQCLSVRQTVETLWCQLGGPATLAKTDDLENCETFFCLLENLDTGGTIDDLQELTKQVDQLYAVADPKAEKQIQIMTIHKAKGLEFDHVILPGLGKSPRSNQDDLLVWLLQQNEQQQEKLILAPIRATGHEQTPIYNYINNTNKAKQAYEDVRLLYVAITRCKKSLHLLGHATLKNNHCKPTNGSPLAYLWPLVKENYKQNRLPDLDQANATLNNIVDQKTKRLFKDWSLPDPPTPIIWKNLIKNASSEAISEKMLQEQNVIEFNWAGEKIKHIGSVVHNAIQRIAEEGLVKWDNERLQAERPHFYKALQQLGLSAKECPDAVNHVHRALKNMLQDQRGRWILAGSHTEQQNEYRLTGLYNGRLVNVILDRTFIDADRTRWIIDYKTSRHEGVNTKLFLDHERERYQQQLEKYGALIEQFDDKPIKLGLYFPLLKGWREWDFNKRVAET